MTGKDREKDIQSQFDRLTEALVKDVLESSDGEILEDANEDFGDASKLANEMRELIDRAISEEGKKRLQAAKQRVAERKGHAGSSTKILHLPLDEKRSKFRDLANNDRNLLDGMTLAARNEDELTEQDLDAVFEALLRLGAIDEDGNPS